MIRLAKLGFFLLSLFWTGFYFYETWAVASLFHLYLDSFTAYDFGLAFIVGLGPLILAGALLIIRWPAKLKN